MVIFSINFSTEVFFNSLKKIELIIHTFEKTDNTNLKLFDTFGNYRTLNFPIFYKFWGKEKQIIYFSIETII
jgi:hypothetical protein